MRIDSLANGYLISRLSPFDVIYFTFKKYLEVDQ